MSISTPTLANTAPPLQQLPATALATALTSSADAAPYKNYSSKEMAAALLANHKAVDSYGNPHFTTHALQQLANGIQENGQPATQEQKELAKEMLKRQDLLDSLDLYPQGGVEDGRIEWDALSVMAGKFSQLSDSGLMLQARKHHKEFDSTGNGYVNFNELKQAAGKLPSNRQFSDEAKAVATELLQRGSLLEKLDIGVGFLGFAGKQDERYDIDNLNHLIRKSSTTPNHPFRSKTD